MRKAIKNIEDPTDPFKPFDINDLEGDFVVKVRKECEEFGMLVGEKEVEEKTKISKTKKKGFNSLVPECQSCKLGLLCLALGRVETFEIQAKQVKEQLGHTWFLDENRVKELSQKYVEDQIDYIFGKLDDGRTIDKKTFMRSIEEYTVSADGLRSVDPELPAIIYQRIMNEVRKEADVIESTENGRVIIKEVEA